MRKRIMLPVYVINLDKRPDRWIFMQNQLRKIEVQSKRISAVDGTTPCLSLIKGNSIKQEKKVRMACSASHRKALKDFLFNTNADAALVLEDDVEISSDLPKILNSMDWWPSDAGLIKVENLEGNRRRLHGPVVGFTSCGRKIRHILSWNSNTGGYIIKRKHAEIVVDALSTTTLPVDNMMFHMRFSKIARSLKPLQIVPAMVRQRPDMLPSDMELYRMNVPIHRRKNRIDEYTRGVLCLPYRFPILYKQLTMRATRIRIDYVDKMPNISSSG